MKEYIKSATEMDFQEFERLALARVDSAGRGQGTKMDFQEFERWAREYLVGQFLDNGLQGMKGGLYVILSQVALNEVWGGNQKQKK